MSYAQLQEWREKRMKLLTEARALHEENKGDLNAEQNTRFEALMHDAADLVQKITREEALLTEENNQRTSIILPNGHDPSKPIALPTPGAVDGSRTNIIDMAAYRAAIRPFLIHGKSAQLTDDQKRLIRLHEEYRAILQADSDIGGGFLVPQEELANQFLKNVDDEVMIRSMATKFTVAHAVSLGVPKLVSDPSDAEWTTELRTGSEDTSMEFGKRNLFPHPFAKRIKISKDLLRHAMLNVEDLVLKRMAFKFAVTEEKGFLTGSGDKQPLGLFTASPEGISTSRDFVCGTTTQPTADLLKAAQLNQKSQYQKSCKWLVSRTFMLKVSTIKTGDGQYLLQPGMQAGMPDVLLGRPFFMSEYVPSTFTTGQYVGMYGDFSWYWIVDALDLSLQILDQLYAETNQNGYIMRKSADGCPVLEEAFTRLKLA